MECFLMDLCPSNELLEVFWMFIFCNHYLAWFTKVATIPDTLFTFFKMKIKCIVIPIIFGLSVSSSPEYCDVMLWWYMRPADPSNAWFTDGQTEFILQPTWMSFPIIPLLTRIKSHFLCHESSTVSCTPRLNIMGQIKTNFDPCKVGHFGGIINHFWTNIFFTLAPSSRENRVLIIKT